MAKPLAELIRPQTLKEFIGQEHLVGKKKPIALAIKEKQIHSMILWGPPGCGKTTLARVIANEIGGQFFGLSAVSAGKEDVKKVIQTAQRLREQTILFLDEIHRFNKAQQDYLLPYVENGTVTFIGATTENPSFEVISPLLSRARIFALRPLTEEEVKALVERALKDGERGLGGMGVEIEEKALEHLALMAGGDARVALNGLEMAAFATPKQDGKRLITLATVEDALQQRALLYDREGDQHYDHISALHKALRGSDPDGALYWLGGVLGGGGGAPLHR